MSTLGRAQRRAVRAHARDHRLVVGLAALDRVGQARAGDLDELDAGVEAVHDVAVAAARDRRLGGEQAHAAVARELHRGARLGREHADHGHVERALQVAERGRGGGVAGDHDQLDARADEPAADLLGIAAQLVGRAPAVREARGVAGVEEVLVRHRDEALVEHREATHAGVEHANRTLRVHAVDGSRRSSSGRHARLPSGCAAALHPSRADLRRRQPARPRAGRRMGDRALARARRRAPARSSTAWTPWSPTAAR